MKKLLVLLAMVLGFLVSGCTSLNKNFVQDVKNDLGIEPIFCYQAKWIPGAKGYQDAGFLLGFPRTIIQGILICDQNEVYFVEEHERIQKYTPNFKFKYLEISQVAISRWGAGRRLVIFIGNDVRTFEIRDKEETSTIYNFILDKIRR